MPELTLLILLLLTHSAPIAARNLLQSRWQQPVDGGVVWRDGRPLFGASKTWRGIVAALATSTLLAAALGLGWVAGLLLGFGAMGGDLFTSFIKRRLAMPPSSRATGLDQLPESLLPLMLCKPLLDYSWLGLLLTAVAFMLLNIFFSPLLYRLGFRNRPF